jgi:hypothetical protein
MFRVFDVSRCHPSSELGASLPANAFRSELARLEQVLPDRTVFLFAVHPKAEIFWI